jgi:hypothetical protein
LAFGNENKSRLGDGMGGGRGEKEQQAMWHHTQQYSTRKSMSNNEINKSQIHFHVHNEGFGGL